MVFGRNRLALRVERREAVKARRQAVNQLRTLLVAAPDPLRQQLHGLSGQPLLQACTRLATGTLAHPLLTISIRACN